MRKIIAAPIAFLACSGMASAQVEDDTAAVVVISHPPGARVWRGDVLLGTTTPPGLRLTGLPPGRVTLTLTTQGYAPATRVVDIAATGGPDVVEVRLAWISTDQS